MVNRFLIYALADPETGDIRYIGRSSSGMERPKMHFYKSLLARCPHSHKNNWIKSLMKRGLKPDIIVLEEFPNDSALNVVEVQAIEHYRSMGFDLTNTTTGGEGVAGVSLSPEHKAKISAALRGVKKSEETRKRMSKAATSWQLGRKHSPNLVEKRIAPLRGRKRPQEVLRRMSEGRRRAWALQKEGRI